MSTKTTIEWTNATWNPVRGCAKVNDECLNCYAMGVAHRFGGPGQPYEGLTRKIGGRGEWNGTARPAPNMLEDPLSWTEPRLIFVNSMSDLFHNDIEFQYIDKVFAMMAMCPQHRFQVLTKRPDRMLTYVLSTSVQRIHETAKGQLGYDHPKRRAVNDWPLPNVWLGVSAGRRKSWDAFVPVLRQVPAAVRFISAEPLLEDIGQVDLTGIDWVIAGGESGHQARPMLPSAVRSLRDQCSVAGVPFLFKQWGEWRRADLGRAGDPGSFAIHWPHDPGWVMHAGYPRQFTMFGHDALMERVGKKAAGRLLDDIEHNGFPEARHV